VWRTWDRNVDHGGNQKGNQFWFLVSPKTLISLFGPPTFPFDDESTGYYAFEDD